MNEHVIAVGVAGAVLAGLAGGGLATHWPGRRRRGLDDALAAVDGCRRLQRTIALMQQHRGLSAGWLGGNAAFAARLAERRAALELLWPGLNAVAVDETARPRPCLTVNDLNLLRFRWHECVAALEAPGADAEASLARHTQLIARLLEWLSALGEARIELPARGVVDTPVVRDFAHRLPALAECLGQARALACGAAAAGHCAPVARVRLRFLVGRAESLLADVRAGGGEAAAVAGATGLIREHVLTGERVSVDAETCFNGLTQAIDSVFAGIDRAGERIADSLRAGGARDGDALAACGG